MQTNFLSSVLTKVVSDDWTMNKEAKADDRREFRKPAVFSVKPKKSRQMARWDIAALPASYGLNRAFSALSRKSIKADEKKGISKAYLKELKKMDPKLKVHMGEAPDAIKSHWHKGRTVGPSYWPKQHAVYMSNTPSEHVLRHEAGHAAGGIGKKILQSKATKIVGGAAALAGGVVGEVEAFKGLKSDDPKKREKLFRKARNISLAAGVAGTAPILLEEGRATTRAVMGSPKGAKMKVLKTLAAPFGTYAGAFIPLAIGTPLLFEHHRRKAAKQNRKLAIAKQGYLKERDRGKRKTASASYAPFLVELELIKHAYSTKRIQQLYNRMRKSKEIVRSGLGAHANLGDIKGIKGLRKEERLIRALQGERNIVPFGQRKGLQGRSDHMQGEFLRSKTPYRIGMPEGGVSRQLMNGVKDILARSNKRIESLNPLIKRLGGKKGQLSIESSDDYNRLVRLGKLDPTEAKVLLTGKPKKVTRDIDGRPADITIAHEDVVRKIRGSVEKTLHDVTKERNKYLVLVDKYKALTPAGKKEFNLQGFMHELSETQARGPMTRGVGSGAKSTHGKMTKALEGAQKIMPGERIVGGDVNLLRSSRHYGSFPQNLPIDVRGGLAAGVKTPMIGTAQSSHHNISVLLRDHKIAIGAANSDQKAAANLMVEMRGVFAPNEVKEVTRFAKRYIPGFEYGVSGKITPSLRKKITDDSVIFSRRAAIERVAKPDAESGLISKIHRGDPITYTGGDSSKGVRSLSPSKQYWKLEKNLESVTRSKRRYPKKGEEDKLLSPEVAAYTNYQRPRGQFKDVTTQPFQQSGAPVTPDGSQRMLGQKNRFGRKYLGEAEKPLDRIAREEAINSDSFRDMNIRIKETLRSGAGKEGLGTPWNRPEGDKRIQGAIKRYDVKRGADPAAASKPGVFKRIKDYFTGKQVGGRSKGLAATPRTTSSIYGTGKKV